MKKFTISTIIFILTSLTLCGQVSKKTYKKFSDTTFLPGDIILAPAIIFNLGNCDIRSEGKDSANIIADFLKKHPTFKIELGVHADIRGKKDANLKLSECRALSLLNYLTKDLSLPSDNLVAKGYGAAYPICSEAYINKMTRPGDSPEEIESYHIKNKRVEVKILRTK